MRSTFLLAMLCVCGVTVSQAHAVILYDKAYRLLESEAVRAALDVTREPPRVRDRYPRRKRWRTRYEQDTNISWSAS